jgi:hypothetical protein
VVRLVSIEILFAVWFLCGVQNVVGGAAYQTGDGHAMHNATSRRRDAR